jgi:hypothetical protein
MRPTMTFPTVPIMFKRLSVIALGAAATLAAAQPAAFPEAAQLVSGDALRAKIAGKTFKGTSATIKPVKIQFNDNGFVFMTNSTGGQDSGKWRVDGSTLCTELRRNAASTCNEVRVAGEMIYMLRTNGELMSLVVD